MTWGPGHPNSARRVQILGARDFLVVTGSPDERIAAIAQRQRGRVARRQLLAAGVTTEMVRHRLRTGHLIRIYRGVYAVGHLARIELARETASLLVCRDGALLSHHSAAALWRIRPSTADAEPVEVLVLGSESARQPGILCHRTRTLHPRDVRIRQGLPVTSPARTLLDITPDLSTRELEWTLDEALTSRIMSNSQLGELLARNQTRRGTPSSTRCSNTEPPRPELVPNSRSCSWR